MGLYVSIPLVTASAASEKLNITIIDRNAPKRGLTALEKEAILQAQKENTHLLRIPRRLDTPPGEVAFIHDVIIRGQIGNEGGGLGGGGGGGGERNQLA